MSESTVIPAEELPGRLLQLQAELGLLLDRHKAGEIDDTELDRLAAPIVGGMNEIYYKMIDELSKIVEQQAAVVERYQLFIDSLGLRSRYREFLAAARKKQRRPGPGKSEKHQGGVKPWPARHTK